PNAEKVIEKMTEVDPVRSSLAKVPKGTRASGSSETSNGVDVQYKYDGFRVQIHKDGKNVRMFSRNLEEMTHMFPELIKATLEQVKADTVILDTEALAYNPQSEEFLPFQETTKRRRKHGIEEAALRLPLKAFVFDILYKNGKQLLDEPLTKRLEILKDTIKDDGVLIRTKNQTVKDAKALQLLLDDAISKGLEGLVVKRLQSPYEAGGRNFNWVKLKRHSDGELTDTIDCVILGYITGRGKRAEFGAGALLVGVYDKEKDEFVSISRIGTGLTDAEWREIHKRADKIRVDHKPARVNSMIEPSVWIEPKIVIEVLADEITRSPLHTAGASTSSVSGEKTPGFALRFPRLVSFRNDKKAEEATNVDEIKRLYNIQYDRKK
ncbi:MAG: ATP-dependent DNA ligase, partial [Candidatus Levybacteria bacterium]|nr:ATP-dependent DNA ligase [Candidatus Levybacteria bacterium]